MIAPLTGGAVKVVGDVAAPHAWSTIKPAIAVAVANARRAGDLGGSHHLTPAEEQLIRDAIENSDNQAADSLFGELGSVPAATQAVQRVLDRAGDTHTTVNARETRPGFSTYGQTSWPMGDAAAFYRELADGCLADKHSTSVILDAMARVTPTGGAGWGLAPAGFEPLAFKDGLGPEDGLSHYTAEQYGIVGHPGAGGYVIGIVAETDGAADDAYAAASDLANRAADALRGYKPSGPPVACGNG